MGLIERSREVQAEPDQVWEVLVDVGSLPKVSPHTVEVRHTPDRLTHQGERFTQVVAAAGKRFESEWEVRRFDAGRAIAIEGSVGFGVRYCLTESVEPCASGGSTLAVRIQYKLPFGPLGRVASRLGVERLAATEADQVLANIAAMAEARPPPHPGRRVAAPRRG